MLSESHWFDDVGSEWVVVIQQGNTYYDYFDCLLLIIIWRPWRSNQWEIVNLGDERCLTESCQQLYL
jgi:hypothetical protein